MIGKINCFNIVKAHTSTLRRQDSNKVRYSDILLFYVFPALISGSIIYFFPKILDGVIPLLITALSIFAALLFNLLLLVHGAITRNDLRKNTGRLTYLREIFNNISFAILASVATIVITLIYSQFVSGCILSAIFTYIIYYLVILFILTLLMILKRIHILLEEETKAT